MNAAALRPLNDLEERLYTEKVEQLHAMVTTGAGSTIRQDSAILPNPVKQ